MGWTSENYTEGTHLKWKLKDALNFCNEKFNTDNYQIIKFWYDPAKEKEDRNVIYMVLKHPKGYNFIVVVLVEIFEGEIFYKEIPSSFCPVEDRCPIEFLDLIEKTDDELHNRWIKKVLKNNVKYDHLKLLALNNL